MVQDSVNSLPMTPQGHVGGNPSLLQVVLLAFFANGERDQARDQYAAIRFPQSFEEAMTSIRDHLDEYLTRNPADDALDIYAPMLNNRNEWIWAKSDQKNWDLVVDQLRRTKRALGVRERTERRKEPGPPGARGRVYLTCGVMQGGMRTFPNMPDELAIERPTSYQEAVKLMGQRDGHKKQFKGRDPSAFKFTFYTFFDKNSTGNWMEFPIAAYEDEVIWRSVVPKPNEILGYMLHERS